MITKAKLIRNVGKFYGFAAKGDGLDWHKNTFVFAPNAYGKSTVVDVLRSLRDNEPKLIRARKTLGVKEPPEAVIIIDGENHVFNGTRWDKPFPLIQIFDVPFIYANILALEIGHEHKKNIHRIIIGAQGIKLAEELAALKTKEKAKSQEVASFAGQFNRSGFTFSMDAFLAIPPAEETAVGARIQKLEQDIKSKGSEAFVQALGHPQQISAPSFDLSTARALAAKKLAAAHEAAEKQILAHIDRNFKDKAQARQFIRQGFELRQADCPFCGQDLKNAADLLKAYREYFDEAFRAFQQGVARQVTSIEKWNLDNDLTALVSTHNANLTTVRQWESFLGAIGLPNVAAKVEKYRAGLTQLKDIVQSELVKKQKDPNVDADLPHFDTFVSELAGLRSEIETYNTSVVDFTERSKHYVANLPKSDSASIRAALAKEQQIKLRFEPEWIKWAAEYPAAKKEADDLLNRKIAKQNGLEAYSKSIFDTYQNRINELLVTLGTDFTITGLTGKTDERANESYIDFGFLILQHTVPLTTHQDDAPCFKNTLSEGDKSTLAFAFFIAALEKTPELEKQIIVFDDPLSSLDETRREATARLLLALSPTVNQLNIFTHKKDFLHMLCDKISANKVLQVRFDKKKGSWLESFDVEDDRKGDFAHMVESMERYLVEDFGPTPEAMQGNIRKMYEVVLKTKYYKALTVAIKGKKGLAKLLETLFAERLLDGSLKAKLFDLCNMTNGPHHGEIIDAPSMKLSRDELIPLIRDALSLLEKV